MTAANDTSKIAYTVKEACEATGIGRSKLYEMIQAGEVEVTKIGTRTLIHRSVLERLFAPHQAAA